MASLLSDYEIYRFQIFNFLAPHQLTLAEMKCVTSYEILVPINYVFPTEMSLSATGTCKAIIKSIVFYKIHGDFLILEMLGNHHS